MKEQLAPYDIPYAIDITLYKHNYYDRLIISYLKKYAQYIPSGNTNESFIVNVKDFKRILSSRFNSELSSMKGLIEIEVSKNVNSVHFLARIIDNFQNLKYVKVTVSPKRTFTRLVELTNNKSYINFDYKIITSIIDLTLCFSKKSEYKLINEVLKKIGLIKPDIFGTKVSYIKTTSQELIGLLGVFEGSLLANPENPDPKADKYIQAIDVIYDIIDRKAENDNCKIILITDYVD